MKHLLKMMDLSKAEIIAILDLADQLKRNMGSPTAVWRARPSA